MADHSSFIETWQQHDGASFVRSMGTDGGWHAPHVEILQYRIANADEGMVELDWTVPEPLLNPAGIAHGGFLVAMLDDAAGLAVASSYPRFVPQLTVQLSSDFLLPVHPEVTHRVVGRVVRRGRTTSVADGTVETPDGTVLARCTGVFQPNRRAIPEGRWEEAGLT